MAVNQGNGAIEVTEDKHRARVPRFTRQLTILRILEAERYLQIALEDAPADLFANEYDHRVRQEAGQGFDDFDFMMVCACEEGVRQILAVPIEEKPGKIELHMEQARRLATAGDALREECGDPEELEAFIAVVLTQARKKLAQPTHRRLGV